MAPFAGNPTSKPVPCCVDFVHRRCVSGRFPKLEKTFFTNMFFQVWQNEPQPPRLCTKTRSHGTGQDVGLMPKTKKSDPQKDTFRGPRGAQWCPWVVLVGIGPPFSPHGVPHDVHGGFLWTPRSVHRGVTNTFRVPWGAPWCPCVDFVAPWGAPDGQLGHLGLVGGGHGTQFCAMRCPWDHF